MEQSERRRSPRIRLPHQEQCELHLRTRVQLIDISLSGVLFAADMPLPVGAGGQLRFGLGGAAFAPTVRIKRRASTSDQRRFGTVFTSMDEGSRRRLEEFLRKATP